jgi:glycosyltransferase involved in cell wall biosynthesis
VHLAILTQYYPPEVGAPQTRLSELVVHFTKKGHRVTVLTAMPNYPTGNIYSGYGGLCRRERREGVEIIRTFIYPTQSASFIRRLTNYFSFVLSSAIFGSFFLRRPTFLLVESPPLFLGLAGIWLSRLKRARLIFNVSDLWPESAVRLGMIQPGSLAFKISSRLEAYCYQLSWLITGQSKSILADINDRFPKCPTFHLSNGVETARFRQETDLIRGGVNSEGKCIALYAGLHGLAQGLDQILNAANLLRDDRRFRLVLIGDGPEKNRLLRKARELNLTNIEFCGPRPSAEIPALLAAADIILITLKAFIPGAVPSKLYEAMASNKPVVLVAAGEAADIVREYDAGFVVKPDDIDAFVMALRTLGQSTEVRQRMGANGRAAAEEHFDRTKIAKRFIDYLENHQDLQEKSERPIKTKSARTTQAA